MAFITNVSTYPVTIMNNEGYPFTVAANGGTLLIANTDIPNNELSPLIATGAINVIYWINTEGDYNNLLNSLVSGPGWNQWKGVWSNTTAYVLNDTVSEGGWVYQALSSNTNNVPPNVTYWNLIGQVGTVNAVSVVSENGILAAVSAAQAEAAAASASASASGVTVTGTSTTSLTPSIGVVTLTTQIGMQFTYPQYVIIASQANATNFMFGQVSTYDPIGGVLVVNVSVFGGTGAHTDWKIALSGLAGAGINWTGAWSSMTTYSVFSGVSLNGSSYLCTASNTNTPPPNASYWNPLSLGINNRGNWATSTIYNVNDVMKDFSGTGNVYQCLVQHTSGILSIDITAGNWYLLVDVSGATTQANNAASSASAASASAAAAAASAAASGITTALPAAATTKLYGGTGSAGSAVAVSTGNLLGIISGTLNVVSSPALITPTIATSAPAQTDSSLLIPTTSFVQTAVNGGQSISVAGSSNVTLSASQAIAQIFTFTGALTGNINVIIPAVYKTFVVQNSTSGAFSLTVKTPSGTGILVTQGHTQELTCDGTNVLLSSNDIIGSGLSPLAGSSNIVTVGTISTGVWNGTILTGTYGGTGVNNSSKTITIGGNFSTTGAFTTNFTTTANTSVTLPTTGTLSTTTNVETLSGKTITALKEVKTVPTISSGTLTLDCSTGNAFALTLSSNITTITMTNVPAAGTFYGFILDLTMTGTAYTITWMAGNKWASGTPPTLTSTSSKRDSFAIYTWDGGTSWVAAIVGQNL